MKERSSKSLEYVQQIRHLKLPLEEVIKKVKENKNVSRYAYIIHDKDVNKETQEPVEPHIHVALTFRKPTTPTVLANYFGDEHNRVEYPEGTANDMFIYLCHANAPEKYPYPVDEVKTNFDYASLVDRFREKDAVKPLKLAQYGAMIDEGRLKPYNLPEIVPIDTYARYKRYFDNAFAYRQQKIKKVDREMQVVFITGASGVGKTSLAKDIAEEKGYHLYISSGGKNPLDDYKGEECIVLDDLRDSTYSVADLLKLLDNNTDSMVGCRFYNKSLAECRLVIITTVKSLKDYYLGLQEHDKEPIEQLKRRCGLLIQMSDESISYFRYDSQKRQHVYVMSLPNAYPFRQKPAEEQIEEVQALARAIQKKYTGTPVKTPVQVKINGLEELPDETESPF